jgi:outer membrane protein
MRRRASGIRKKEQRIKGLKEKMKRYYVPVMILLVALALLLPAAANAEKIGFVDVREVLAKSDSGKKALAEFQKAFEKKKAAIQSREGELKKQTEAFQKQRPGMTEIAAKERELDLQKKYREFQRMVSRTEEEMRQKDQELSRKLIPEIYKVIHAISAKEGYTLILDINNPVVIYSYKGNNITEQVLAEFNKIKLGESKKEPKKAARKSRKK